MARFSLYVYASLLIAFTSMCAPVSWGQITDLTDTTTVPIPGVGHDYVQMLSETVDPSSGSLSLRIAVSVPSGRKIQLPFSFSYDTNGVHFPQSFGRGFSYESNLGFLNSGGWSYSMPMLSGVVTSYTPLTGSGTCYDQSNYIYQDPGGGRHQFYRLRRAAGTPHCHNATVGDADDYYQASLSNITGVSATATLADANGTAFVFSPNPCHAYTLSTTAYSLFCMASSAEDRNGNQLTITDLNTGNGAFTVTDTLGRAAISSSGFGTTGNTVTVPESSAAYSVTWGTATTNLPSVNWTQVAPDNDGFHCFPTTSIGGSQPVITAITLPNTQKYQFTYDPTYGTLKTITYPSGAKVTYAWSLSPKSAAFSFPDSGYGSQQDNNPDACQYVFATLAVAHRYVSFDGTTTALQQDFVYAPTTWDITWPQHWDSKTTTVTTSDIVRGTSFTTVYTYANLGTQSGVVGVPVEQTVVYNGTGGTTLQTVNKTWYDRYLLASDQATSGTASSRAAYSYGFGAQVTEKDEYDGTSGLLRKTVTNYQSFVATPIFTLAPSIFAQPCQTIVYDSTGTNRVAEADYFYDGTTSTTPCATATTQALAGTGSYTGHDEPLYGASANVPRGNLTKKVQSLIGGTSPTTTYTYDETGQMLSMTDPCGITTCSDMLGTSQPTSYLYSDMYTMLSGGANVGYTPGGNTNAFVTQVTDPLGHQTNVTYDFYNGQLTKATDANGRFTAYIYNDPFARPTQITSPDTGLTQYMYNDLPYNPSTPSPSVTSTIAITSTLNKVNTVAFDGVGHAIKMILSSDPDGTTNTTASYDGMGKSYQVTNPYRSTGDTTYGVTTYTYDALGRMTQIAEPDGSSVLTSYSGNQSTVTDEVGNQRISQTDGLGRLTYVWEAPSSLNYLTGYTYDALNNLLLVTQKGGSGSSGDWRPRSFVYDSLSRLTSATNPESGTTTYTYDANSNVSSRVAPKPGQIGTLKVTTNYSYDALNRLTKKAYTGLTTSTAQFAYDGGTLTGCGQTPPVITSPTNLIGRRSAMCAMASGSSWSFDPMGRPLIESRKNKGSVTKTLNVNYTYNLDGSLKTLTYPSGDLVTYIVGGAGRTTQVSDPLDNFVGYTNNFATYAPTGALASMTNGHGGTEPGLVTSNTYNDRLQPVLLSASTNPIFELCYDFHLHVAVGPPCNFGASTTGDNGNVFQIVNKTDSTRSAVFAYDPLNRISQANTTDVTSANPNCWGEAYTIDAWGNLTNIAGAPGLAANCFTEMLNAAPATNNKLNGVTYDAAGNVLNDGNGNTPTYDAEDRILTDGSGVYSYDADGARISKSTGTMYWTGSSGEVLAETDLSGTINEEYVYFGGARIARMDRPTNIATYFFSNHLGTASATAYAYGAVTGQTDYYPFGGVAFSSGQDANHFRFTGKERDNETCNPRACLDYFGARHYSYTMGRFMTPDPLVLQRLPANAFILHLGNPQSWNKYAYVMNNPLSLTDPTGLDFYLTCSGKDTATCNGGHVGSTDDKGKFTATVVTSAQLQDPNSGVTGTVTESGVKITNASGTYTGQFINGTPASTLQGSGALSNFTFNITGQNPGNLLRGTWQFSGTPEQAAQQMSSHGAWTYPLDVINPFHPNSQQYRFSDPNDPSGPSIHISQPLGVGLGIVNGYSIGAQTFPSASEGEFHVDTHGTTMGHIQDIIEVLTR